MKALIALAVLGGAATLAAQPAADPRAQLKTARIQAAAARDRSARMETLSRAARDEAARARAAQAAVAARIQAAEADISAAEARLAILQRLQRDQERRLAARQQPVVKLVAALETMARRPAAAALVQPGTLTDLVHVRALLSTMAPQVAARTAGLREDVARARQLRQQAAVALAQLRSAQRASRLEQQRLAELETRQRRQSADLAGNARLEAARAVALGESTRGLEDLVAKLERQGDLRNRLASLPGPVPRPARLTDSLPGKAPEQSQPSRLPYRLPVLGPITRGFGEALPSGVRSRGVSIAAQPGAIVVAPAAGRMTFAALYRGYGAIAIVDHGDGYISLITGLASNIARVGDIVDQGSPLGRAGGGGVTIELRQAGEPIDFSTLVG